MVLRDLILMGGGLVDEQKLRNLRANTAGQPIRPTFSACVVLCCFVAFSRQYWVQLLLYHCACSSRGHAHKASSVLLLSGGRTARRSPGPLLLSGGRTGPGTIRNSTIHAVLICGSGCRLRHASLSDRTRSTQTCLSRQAYFGLN